jgi:hypothetical protein
MAVTLCVPLMASTAMVASGQNGYNRGYDNRGNNQYQNNRGYSQDRGYTQYQDNRGYNHYQYDRGSHQQFSNGAYEGGRGGDYGYDRDGRYSEYDRRYHGNGNYYGDPQYRRDNGIGPGKGALIGGAGGAALGAILGGGKGAFVGGAAGAGIGAILGEHAQQERREQPY